MSEFTPSNFAHLPSTEFYEAVNQGLDALLAFEKDGVAQLANASSYLKYHLTEINWVGFYLLRDKVLVLGPFQGLPACTRIPVGRGVCGTAAQACKTIVVDDVDAFPGHIACDSNSRSEIVVPLEWNGSLVGLLDVDSPVLSRFVAEHAAGIVRLAKTVEKSVNWATLFPSVSS